MAARGRDYKVFSSSARALAWLLLLAGCSRSVAIPANPNTSRLVERSFFGLHIHWTDINTKVLIPPVGALRLWDTRTNWSHLQPSPVRWDFRRLDKFVDLAESIDADALYVFADTPQWAASRMDQKGKYGNDSSSPPANIADWDDYVRAIVTRYKGRIKYYEILNEPKFIENSDCLNVSSFYCSRTKDVVSLVNRTTRLVRSIDKDARILGPGLDSSGPAKQFAIEGGLKTVDAMAYHFYAPAKGSALTDKIKAVKDITSASGRPNLPIWNTEAGFPFYAAGGNDSTGAKVDLADGPGAISRQLVKLAAAGITRTYYFAWDNSIFGLSDHNGESPTPIGDAYLTTMSWLLGARISPCELIASVWRCKMTRGKSEAELAWVENGRASITGAGETRTRFIQPLNGAYDIARPGAPISVSSEPTLIVFDTPKWGQALSYITAPR